MKRVIEGINPIPGFNGSQNIDLNVYEEIDIPTQIDGTFSHIGSIKLDDVDEDDSIWLNDAVRADGNTLERIEDFVNNFEVTGFNTKLVPPIMGTDGKPRDGRGRVIAAKRRGEKYIPALFYTYSNDTERCRISNGLKENLRHDPAYPSTREDVIGGALELIGNKELENDEGKIRDWLHHELNAHRKFNSRNITIIVDSIKWRGENGGKEAVRVRSRQDWERWIKKNLDLKVNTTNGKIGNNVWLTSVDNDTYPFRVYVQSVLKSLISQLKSNKNKIIKDPIEPPKIILYTNLKTHREARKQIEDFTKILKQIVKDSYTLVSRDYGFPTDLVPKSKQYVIIGAVPQLIGKHNVDGDELVPIKDY